MIPDDIRLLDPLFRAKVVSGSENYTFDVWKVIRMTPKGFWIMKVGTDFQLLKTSHKDKSPPKWNSNRHSDYDDARRQERADAYYESEVRGSEGWVRETKWLRANTPFVEPTKEAALEALAYRKRAHAYHAFRRYQEILASMDAVCKAAGVDTVDVEADYVRRQSRRRGIIFFPYD